VMRMRAGHVVAHSFDVSLRIGRSSRARVFFYDRAADPSYVLTTGQPVRRRTSDTGLARLKFLRRAVAHNTLFIDVSVAASAYAAAVYFVPSECQVRQARRLEPLICATQIKHKLYNGTRGSAVI